MPDVVLSASSSTKYLMWKDLVDRAEVLKRNPVVRHLLKQCFGERFKIDATPVNRIWGEIAIRDIGQSPTAAMIGVAGREVVIRVLDV